MGATLRVVDDLGLSSAGVSIIAAETTTAGQDRAIRLISCCWDFPDVGMFLNEAVLIFGQYYPCGV